MGNNIVLNIIKEVKVTYDHDYYKAISALNILKNSDDVLNTYLTKKIDSNGELILSIYGLLQNLFVYIDALYDLARTLLNNKHSININQNKHLRKIKHIRNDIVGHPTYRTYSRGGVSYSLINFLKSNQKEIYYTIYYYIDKKEEVYDETIDIFELIKQYKFESEIILTEIKNRLTFKPSRKDLYLDAYNLVVNVNNDNSKTLLESLKSSYYQTYHKNGNSHNRIIWRFKLLEKAYNLDVSELAELKDFLKYYQANKLYLMFLELEDVYYEKVSYNIPYNLKQLIKEIKIKNLTRYVYNLNDSSHFYFKNNVNELYLKTKNPLFKYLLSEKDSDLVYLVGSVIRNLSLLK